MACSRSVSTGITCCRCIPSLSARSCSMPCCRCTAPWWRSRFQSSPTSTYVAGYQSSLSVQQLVDHEVAVVCVSRAQGVAFAGGAVLALACDQRLFSSKASVSFSEAKVGLPLPTCIAVREIEPVRQGIRLIRVAERAAQRRPWTQRLLRHGGAGQELRRTSRVASWLCQCSVPEPDRVPRVDSGSSRQGESAVAPGRAGHTSRVSPSSHCSDRP